MNAGLVPLMVRCECWAFLTWMQDEFLPWSDVSARCAFLTCMLDVFLTWSDVSVGWHFLIGSDISAEEDEDLHGGYAYNHHEKGMAL